MDFYGVNLTDAETALYIDFLMVVTTIHENGEDIFIMEAIDRCLQGISHIEDEYQVFDELIEELKEMEKLTLDIRRNWRPMLKGAYSKEEFWKEIVLFLEKLLSRLSDHHFYEVKHIITNTLQEICGERRDSGINH